GRALLSHHLLIEAGVPAGDIAKIFTVGQLRFDGELWQYHVAILVRDSQHGFVVVDPLHAAPLPYPEWLDINQAYGIKHPLSRVRFYVTDARKFTPSTG